MLGFLGTLLFFLRSYSLSVLTDDAKAPNLDHQALTVICADLWPSAGTFDMALEFSPVPSRMALLLVAYS